MCACEGSYVCSRCEGTPFSPYYEEDAHEPMADEMFDGLVADRSGPWTFGDQGWV